VAERDWTFATPDICPHWLGLGLGVEGRVRLLRSEFVLGVRVMATVRVRGLGY